MVELVGSLAMIIIGIILVVISRNIQIENIINTVLYVIGIILILVGILLLILNFVGVVV